MKNTLKALALLGKAAGIVAAASQYQAFADSYAGGKYAFAALMLFGGASILKDIVNRVGDLIDDGKENGSWSAK